MSFNSLKVNSKIKKIIKLSNVAFVDMNYYYYNNNFY